MMESETDVWGMLIEHELAMENLYQAFAQTIGERQELWRQLASDEIRHAGWLRSLREEASTGKCPWPVPRLRPQAIKTSIDYVGKQIERAKRGDLTPLQALSVARDLESALLERQFPRLRDSGPEEIRPLVEKLAEETEKHLKMVTDALESERQKSSSSTQA